MKNNKRIRAGSKQQYGPRLAGKILHDYLENSNESLAVAYRERHDEADGWHANTDLGCDVKTLLRSDVRMKVGKDYQGVLRRDDGSLRLNFRPLKVDRDFSVERYALGVSNELLWALEGQVGKNWKPFGMEW